MARMTSPPNGVKVRMYRQGHGDCFLLAFTGRKGRRKRTVYVLIDCGLKPGSQVKNQQIETVIDDIHEATGGHVDVVIITHEHQDHVNGFAKKKDKKRLFDKISFGQCWLAWTEDGSDELANKLRDRFRDTLLTLAFAQEKVAATPDLAERLSDLLGTEIGDDGVVPKKGQEGAEMIEALHAAKAENQLAAASELAAKSIKGITYKKAIKYLRDRADEGTVFLRPDDPPHSLPHVKGLKVYALGPPRNETLLLDLDPEDSEEFHLASSSADPTIFGGDARGFAQAVAPDLVAGDDGQPFSQRYCFKETEVFHHVVTGVDTPPDDPPRERQLDYLRSAYGGATPEAETQWRRIDDDWLGSAEGLALRLNKEVNNTSLVLAFELPKTGKVLLFTGDAQRGSWIGWSDLEWTDDQNRKITAKDLLARCVLYKVGHHGSHNATLNGTDADAYANIGWMARGVRADDFVAMIPANTKWALDKSRPWRHPLPQIEAALLEKTRGRVFRSDRDRIKKPDSSVLSDAEWRAFQKKITEKNLYFEYTIRDT